jgi:hypothetical protein
MFSPQAVEVSKVGMPDGTEQFPRVRLQATLIDYLPVVEAEELGVALLDAAVAARGGELSHLVKESLHRIRCHAGRTCAEAACTSRPVELEAVKACDVVGALASDVDVDQVRALVEIDASLRRGDDHAG